MGERKLPTSDVYGSLFCASAPVCLGPRILRVRIASSALRLPIFSRGQSCLLSSPQCVHNMLTRIIFICPCVVQGRDAERLHSLSPRTLTAPFAISNGTDAPARADPAVFGMTGTSPLFHQFPQFKPTSRHHAESHVNPPQMKDLGLLYRSVPSISRETSIFRGAQLRLKIWSQLYRSELPSRAP